MYQTTTYQATCLLCAQDKGGIYELTDSCMDGNRDNASSTTSADVIHREIVYDLEGYYYVILTLAIMLDILYTLKRVPNPYMTSGMEMWLYWWLENTIEMEIWYKVLRNDTFLLLMQGFLWWKGCWKEHQDVELNLFCKNARLSQPSHHRPTKSQEKDSRLYKSDDGGGQA
ncbi:uncharacterized protein F5147DRAFT_660016 [Suillus discolor]|uniref:Uncharacterized protein n=1 Tax=Suillus discolor TaxID=1912936 RepID=A0A9P7EQT5_9AGAM|nr:uncharacterized protein F5147DRAFT_660016 [Suillus discolor]KAG2083939.1 hypothetical protein F5147DRAFT_660016 [Suillus discolor]